MKKFEFLPVKKWHTNSVLKGWESDEEKGIEKVHDLPITRTDENQLISIWKCKSFIQRLKFLFIGELTFLCQSHTHPPVSLFIHDQVRKKNNGKKSSKKKSN